MGSLNFDKLLDPAGLFSNDDKGDDKPAPLPVSTPKAAQVDQGALDAKNAEKAAEKRRLLSRTATQTKRTAVSVRSEDNSNGRVGVSIR